MMTTAAGCRSSMKKPDQETTVSRLKFTEWHTLLVRSLRLDCLKHAPSSQLRIESILALLGSIPISKESYDAIESLLPIIEGLLSSSPLSSILAEGETTSGSEKRRGDDDAKWATDRSDEDSDEDDDERRIRISQHDAFCPIRRRSASIASHRLPDSTSSLRIRKTRSRRQKLTRRRQEAARQETAYESESDRPHASFLRNKPKRVYVHERVLISDSDGFAECAGEVPAEDLNFDDTSEVSDRALFLMYRSIFGNFPTRIRKMDTIQNALLVYARFTAVTTPVHGINFLCDHFAASFGQSMCEDAQMSLLIFRKWLNWMKIVRQVSRQICRLGHIAASGFAVPNFDFLLTGISFLLEHLKVTISTSCRLCYTYSSGMAIDEVQIANIDLAIRRTNDVTIKILDDITSLIMRAREAYRIQAELLSQEQHSNMPEFQELGEQVTQLLTTPTFQGLMIQITEILQKRLHLNDPQNSKENRFIFELFASLISNGSNLDFLLSWCLSLPAGFQRMATGTEFVSVLTPTIFSHSSLCANVLRYHLPHMDWCYSSSRGSSFTSSGILPNAGPSQAALKLSLELSKSANVDLLCQICSLVLKYCDLLDAECLLVDVVIPSISSCCQKFKESESDDFMAPCGSMCEEKRGILKQLELVACHLWSAHTSEQVINRILVPYRDFYFSTGELQDVFVAVCSRAIRFNHTVAQNSDLCTWVVERMEACTRNALVDIWVFVSDSAAKYFKLLLSSLNIVRDTMEDNSEAFAPMSQRLLNLTSQVVDICFEWIGHPSGNFRDIHRVSEAMCKALSIHLMLHSDSQNVVDRFFVALKKSLKKEQLENENLLSPIIGSLLDRCISKLPQAPRPVKGEDAESEDDALMGDGGTALTSASRTVLHSDIIIPTIELVTQILDSKDKLANRDEFTAKKLTDKLAMIDRHSKDGQHWLNALFGLCDALLNKGAMPKTCQDVLRFCAILMRRDPKSQDLQRIIDYYKNASKEETKLVILAILKHLLYDRELQPFTSLIFPQTAVSRPIELKKAEDIQETTEGDDENSIKSTSLGANATASSTSEYELEKPSKKSEMVSILRATTSKLAAFHLRKDASESPKTRKKLEDKQEDQSVQADIQIAQEITGNLHKDSAAHFCMSENGCIESSDGLHLSFWLKRNPVTKIQKSTTYLHVFSLGSHELTCSMMVSSRGTIFLEIQMAETRLTKYRAKGFVPENSWVHICYGMKTTGDTVIVQTQIGEFSTNLEIPLIIHIERIVFKFSISFGCVKKKAHFQYQISTFFGFKGLLTQNCIFTLAALGVQLQSLAEAQLDYLHPNIASVTSGDTALSQVQPLWYLRSETPKFVQRLQRAMLFVVHPSSADSYGISILGNDIEPVVIAGHSALLYGHLKEFPIDWCARLVHQRNVSIDDSLTPLGDLSLITYLYAKSVNDAEPASVQNSTLEILLNALRRGCVHTTKAHRLKINDIISRILASPQASITEKTIELLINHCVNSSSSNSCSKNFARRGANLPSESEGEKLWSSSDDEAENHKRARKLDRAIRRSMPDPYVSVIREPALLTYLLSRQMIWVGSEQIQTRSELADQARLRFHHFRFLVGVTATLINQQLATKHWSFNRQQLQNVNLLPKFLHCLLEMIQEPAKFPDFFMEQVFVNDAITIVQALLGSPESPQAIADLWHFIFLSHPANNTYIDHMVVGHCEWINPAFIKDEPEGDLQGESQLSKKLNKILRTVGKDAFLEKWRHGQTLFDIRREYEEIARRRAEGLEDNVLENRDSSPSGSGLGEISDVSSNVATPIPDLLSDIPSTSRLTSGSVPEKLDTSEKSDSQDSGLDDLRHFSENQSPEKRKKDKQQQLKWIVALRAGLMQIMSDVLQNGTDSLLAAIRHDVISWQAIVVLLSHQTDIRIREAALDMLEKFVLRSPPFPRVSFLRLSGFHILASQIRNQPVSSRMADSLFSLMCNETVRLGDGLDGAHLSEMEVDKLSCESFNSIFILYEESVPDVALFWNVNNALLKTFENHWQLQQAMLDCKLVDTMVNTLRRIAYLEQSSESDVVAEKPFASPQLECWSSFAQRIVIMAIPYHEPRLYESCQRFIYLLMLADIQASRDDQYPLNQRLSAHKIIRSQLCQLLHCWLESVRTVFSEEGRSASASSSVDSLYNQNNASSTSLSSDNDYEYIEDNPITPERAGLLDGIAPSSSFVMNSYSNLKEIIKKMGPISRRALQCPYPKRQVGSSSLEAVEILNQRMLLALEMNARIFTILTPTAGQVTEEEENLFHFFLYFMLSSWKKEVGGPVAGRAKNQSRAVHQTVWQLLIQMCRDKVRVFLAQLVAFVLFPAPKKIYETSRAAGHCKPALNWDSPWVEEKRRQIVRALAHELQYKQNLATLLNVNLDYEYALCLGLYELAFLSPLTGSGEAEKEIDRMIRFLSNSRVGRAVDSLSPNALQNLTTDEILAVHSYSEYRKEVTAQMRSKMEVIIDEEGKATAKVSQMAMSVTCEVVEEQNFPRKAFIKATKSELQQFMEAEKILKNLADELCHPEASGFEERHWPIGWALDPTEGPMRERKRMMPYYYSFDAKFFMPEKGEKAAKNREEQPLEKLLVPLNDSTSPLEHVQIDEPTRLYLEATVLRGTFECKGELVFGERNLHFVGDKAKTAQKGLECNAVAMSWRYDQITEVQMRNYLLKNVALEMFTSSGDSHLFVFSSTEHRQQFKDELVNLKLEHVFPNRDNMLHATVQAWRHGAISNFEYLMQLNKLSGRSFNDLMQYPVFPFVLSDYTSPRLDLSNSNSFRNLSRPMAIQDKRMEQHYITNYKCLEAECEKKSKAEAATTLHFGPYHYGSHYSNSGIVAHYLVRLSPFTQTALEYQDNNFDFPDRLFNSFEATWRLASSESTTDFKELLAELFCLPECLLNKDELDMGIRQGGERVWSVKLPVWVPNNDARLFMLIHRQALEALTVTANLNYWVDLIFGFRQTGKPALDAINVFHPATYLNHLNADEYAADELSQSALRTMVRCYGQMPIQLLQSPHQPHLTAAKEKERRDAKTQIPSPIPSVIGVRWGDYVGSPEQDSAHIQVVLSLKGQKVGQYRLTKIVSLPDGTVTGLTNGVLVIAKCSQDNSKDSTSKSLIIESLATIAKSDGLLRFRMIKPELKPWINAICVGNDQVSAMEWCPIRQQLFVAFSSGVIKVYRLQLQETLDSIELSAELLGHLHSVSCLAVCSEFFIAVSGAADGTMIIWDTNRLSFVKSLKVANGSAITSICCSKTSGDIVVVAHQGNGSRVEMYTINGDFVGAMQTECAVVCMTMTNQTEGTAINCIALGLSNGHVELVEMWTLMPVRSIFHEKYREPVVSVEYSTGGKKLFVCLASGRVLCWQNVPSISKTKAPQFQIINPFE